MNAALNMIPAASQPAARPAVVQAKDTGGNSFAAVLGAHQSTGDDDSDAADPATDPATGTDPAAAEQAVLAAGIALMSAATAPAPVTGTLGQDDVTGVSGIAGAARTAAGVSGVAVAGLATTAADQLLAAAGQQSPSAAAAAAAEPAPNSTGVTSPSAAAVLGGTSPAGPGGLPAAQRDTAAATLAAGQAPAGQPQSTQNAAGPAGGGPISAALAALAAQTAADGSAQAPLPGQDGAAVQAAASTPGQGSLTAATVATARSTQADLIPQPIVTADLQATPGQVPAAGNPVAAGQETGQPGTGQPGPQQNGPQQNGSGPNSPVPPGIAAAAQAAAVIAAPATLLDGRTSTGVLPAGTEAADAVDNASAPASPVPAGVAPVSLAADPASIQQLDAAGQAAGRADAQPVIDQVLDHLSKQQLITSRNLRDGAHSAVIHLRPDNLGAVTVTLDVRAGQVRLDLAAGAQALSTLGSDLGQLRNQLADAGLNLADVTLSTQLDSGTGQPAPRRENPPEAAGPTNPAAGEPVPTGKERTAALRPHPPAAPGSLDLLV